MNRRLGLEHKPLDASYGDPQVPKMLCCLWKKQYLLGNTYISVFWFGTGRSCIAQCITWKVCLVIVMFSLPFPTCTSDSPWLEQPEVQLLLQTVINVLLPPRIISTSRSKNFMLESSPAHCSTPGDAGKDLRKEGLAESTSQAAYLGGSLFPASSFLFPVDVCTMNCLGSEGI